MDPKGLLAVTCLACAAGTGLSGGGYKRGESREDGRESEPNSPTRPGLEHQPDYG